MGKRKQRTRQGFAADTRVGPTKVKSVDSRGGGTKTKALRLDHGSFSWPSEAVSRRAQIVGVAYNASEAQNSSKLVKGTVVLLDATPFRLWREELSDASPIEPALDRQLRTNRIHAMITSRPGKSGRADGYILEGEELRFYLVKVYGVGAPP